MSYSIEQFWKKRLPTVGHTPASMTKAGWVSDCAPDESFVEAGLVLRSGFEDLAAPVWLVAAPGAVGKSTFARELCAATGAVYVDLAVAEAVGGSYVVGGLVNNGLFDDWKAGRVTLIIDALDEARLRVTQSAFEDFLHDVVNVAKSGSLPLILLGRVGIVDECWVQLNVNDALSCPIFDIQFFSRDSAINFVLAALHRLARTSHQQLTGPLKTHEGEYIRVATEIVDRLIAASSKDGNHFAGYAPVLEAVAKVIASQANPAQIQSQRLTDVEGQILKQLTTEILVRESGKLVTQMRQTIPDFPERGAYEPTEQLARLASRILQVEYSGNHVNLPSHCVAPYEKAVTSFIEQHPFLDGTGRTPSGAVFSAAIVAHALKTSDIKLSRAAEGYVTGDRHAPNPFLFDFYRALGQQDGVPAGHLGALFESLQAKAGPGEVVRLAVEGDVDSSEPSNTPKMVDIEISISTPETGQVTRIDMKTRSDETLRLGRKLSGVFVDSNCLDVEMGDGRQLELLAPITIQARTLVLRCSELIIKPDPQSAGFSENLVDTGGETPLVLLEVQDSIVEPTAPLVTVRANADLKVTWPGSQAYPWNGYSIPQPKAEAPETADALRALRRLVIAFRSHSKGQLARFKDKIEHARMSKGDVGEALRKKLLDDQVLTVEGPMYLLDPKALGSIVGLSFQDAKMKNYSAQTREYVQAVIKEAAK
ncbi:hypothetical protein KDW63_04955 [Burkholderia cenocepacia]|uniref:hypothetical protein n=1 Tax=Burkholderia cenocepacia TaxID=95486 RepID=UPI001B9A73DD|nr:hypothetical protein [Burkholderia cenocepacia]MBR8293531.1 hypothetical protein [Burkholderia cenocepacia]